MCRAENSDFPGVTPDRVERSVATSEWLLEIPTIEDSTVLLDLDQVHDIEIGFVHTAAGRVQ